MQIGIIAEGKGDCAILRNILWSILEDEPRFLRPEFELDETDLNEQEGYQSMNPAAFSSWTLVKKDCVEKVRLQSFLVDDNIFEEERAIILQLDTAECELAGYDVVRPDKKQDSYCDDLRIAVIKQINTWLEGNYTSQLYYAICIEEMEAWLLPLYENKDSSTSADPKKRFNRIIHQKVSTDKKFKKKVDQCRTEFETMDCYSSLFKKKKNLTKALKFNASLKAFVDSF